MIQVAKKNHYNPCFWTAHWNTRYLERVLSGQRDGVGARQQRVFALNVKSDRIYDTSVENVHYDKNLGVAEITREAAKDFCKRHFPKKYNQFCKDMKGRPDPVYLDFESILVGLESTPAYSILLDVIAKQRIDSPLEKGLLAGFVVVQHLRSHAIMNSLIEWNAELGRYKFEYFWLLKYSLGNTDIMFSHVMMFAPGHWRFFKVDQDTFPLNDSPILVQPNSVMIPLSPRLLLEIDRTRLQPEDSCEYVNMIWESKLDEFRRRMVGNTFREIIFGSSALLEQWRQSPEFRARHELMSNTNSYNKIVEKRGASELWNINAYGNV